MAQEAVAAMPPIDTLDQWVAVAEGFGRDRDRARTYAEKNLTIFLRKHSVVRVGEILVDSTEERTSEYDVRVVVKCRVKMEL